MTITSFGHSCLLIEDGRARILIDPGAYSSGHETLTNIQTVLITHEHADHLHLESLKTMLKNNPAATLLTNRGVGVILDHEGIPWSGLEHGQRRNDHGVAIEGVGQDHAVIYSSVPLVANTGYFVADRLFYPGDALTDPGRTIDILALPVAAPWMRLAEAIDYALAVKPKICFPVHDGGLKFPGVMHRYPAQVLQAAGIEFRVLERGKPMVF